MNDQQNEYVERSPVEYFMVNIPYENVRIGILQTPVVQDGNVLRRVQFKDLAREEWHIPGIFSVYLDGKEQKFVHSAVSGLNGTVYRYRMTTDELMPTSAQGSLFPLSEDGKNIIDEIEGVVHIMTKVRLTKPDDICFPSLEDLPVFEE